MNLIEVMERFPDQESCIEHLERIRWQGKVICPHCECKQERRRLRACGTLALRQLWDFLQSNLWHSLSRHENPPSEMVYGYRPDSQC